MRYVSCCLLGLVWTPIGAQILYNNAALAGLTLEGLRTKPRPSGGDYSEVQPGNTTTGATFRTNAARLSDDFSVTGQPWLVTGVSVFGYQNSATFPTVNTGNFEIKRDSYSGPTVATGTFKSSEFTDIYRIFFNAPDDTRRVQRIRFRFSAVLSPGRYWVVFNAFGDGSLNGPWGPYLTKVGALGTPGANAKQQVYGEFIHWVDVYDAGSLVPQDLPFWIDGYRLPIKVNPGDQQIQGPTVPPPTLFQQAFGPLMETQ